MTILDIRQGASLLSLHLTDEEITEFIMPFAKDFRFGRSGTLSEYESDEWVRGKLRDFVNRKDQARHQQKLEEDINRKPTIPWEPEEGDERFNQLRIALQTATSALDDVAVAMKQNIDLQTQVKLLQQENGRLIVAMDDFKNMQSALIKMKGENRDLERKCETLDVQLKTEVERLNQVCDRASQNAQDWERRHHKVLDSYNNIRGKCGELEKLINHPEIEDFLKGVQLEAAHQTARWGDQEYEWPHHFILVITKLTGKMSGDVWDKDLDKFKHHIITLAALMFNIHRQTNKPTAIQHWFGKDAEDLPPDVCPICRVVGCTSDHK